MQCHARKAGQSVKLPHVVSVAEQRRKAECDHHQRHRLLRPKGGPRPRTDQQQREAGEDETNPCDLRHSARHGLDIAGVADPQLIYAEVGARHVFGQRKRAHDRDDARADQPQGAPLAQRQRRASQHEAERRVGLHRSQPRQDALERLQSEHPTHQHQQTHACHRRTRHGRHAPQRFARWLSEHRASAAALAHDALHLSRNDLLHGQGQSVPPAGGGLPGSRATPPHGRKPRPLFRLRR